MSLRSHVKVSSAVMNVLNPFSGIGSSPKNVFSGTLGVGRSLISPVVVNPMEPTTTSTRDKATKP